MLGEFRILTGLVRTGTSRAPFPVAGLLLLFLGNPCPAQAADGIVYGREIRGALAWDDRRVLVWESVSDGSGEMPVWVYAEGQPPKQVAKIAAEEIQAAVGADVMVFTADQSLLVASVSQPAQPEVLAVPGEWTSITYGPMGFVAGGWGNALAISPDGRAWTRVPFTAPDEGIITQLAWNGKELLALRQTSVQRDGWGVNVSELFLSPDGRTWRSAARFEGGDNYSPVESIAWSGDRWIGHGLGALVELTSDGKSRQIPPTTTEGEEALMSGNVAVFRERDRWLLTSSAGVAESTDLASWKMLPQATSDTLKGVWIGARDGAPRFVGATQADWSRTRVLTLAGILAPATETKIAVAAPAPAAAAPSSVAPTAVASQSTPPIYFKAFNPAAFDWPALLAAAEREAAQWRAPVNSQAGTRKNRLSKGSPWTAADVIAARRGGAANWEIAEVIRPAFDGSVIDTPGYYAIYGSDIGKNLYREDSGKLLAPGLSLALMEQRRTRSAASDALARLVIAQRRAQIAPLPIPVDSPALRARYATGAAAAAYDLWLALDQKRQRAEQSRYPAEERVTYGQLSDETADRMKGQRIVGWPADAPPEAEVVARATAGGYAPAQWLLIQDLEWETGGKTDDPKRRLALARISALAGDARGAHALAKIYSTELRDRQGVAANYAEAEYWLIEAGARERTGGMTLADRATPPWLDLSNLYNAIWPNGRSPMGMKNDASAIYAWLAELRRRGGLLAAQAEGMIQFYRQHRGECPGEGLDPDKALAAVTLPGQPLTPAAWAQEEKKAAAGDARASLALADAGAFGWGVLQDDARALEFYRQAAAQGAGLPAYRALVRLYERGYGVAKDPITLLAWLEKAAATGDLESLLELGDKRRNDFTKHGIPRDLPAAFAAYEKASASGDPRALYGLAVCYLQGLGVAKDETRARALYVRAGEGGHIPAMLDLARQLVADPDPAKKNHLGAAAWYQRAVEAGDQNQRFNLARALEAGGDEAGALRWYRALAEDTPPRAEAAYWMARRENSDGNRDEAVTWFRVALRASGSSTDADLDPYKMDRTFALKYVQEYDEEAGAKPGSLPHDRLLARGGDQDAAYRYAMRVAASNREDALSWLWSAAEAGHAASTATYYAELVKTDKAQADAWVKALADKGNAQAMLIVGLGLAATDRPAALALMEKAATAGNLDALFRLGFMQIEGKQLPKNDVEGRVRLFRSADGGYALAQLTLGRALVTGEGGLGIDPARGIAYLMKVLDQPFVPQLAAQAAVTLGQVYERGATAPGHAPQSGDDPYLKEMAKALSTASEVSSVVVIADKNEALKYYRRALQLGGANAQLSAHIQQLERSLGSGAKGTP